MNSRSCLYAFGITCASSAMGRGVRMPATTSSPWALTRNSPKNSFAPVAGFRVKPTPVPERSPVFPNTISWTLTAVPMSSGIS